MPSQFNPARRAIFRRAAAAAGAVFLTGEGARRASSAANARPASAVGETVRPATGTVPYRQG